MGHTTIKPCGYPKQARCDSEMFPLRGGRALAETASACRVCRSVLLLRSSRTSPRKPVSGAALASACLGNSRAPHQSSGCALVASAPLSVLRGVCLCSKPPRLHLRQLPPGQAPPPVGSLQSLRWPPGGSSESMFVITWCLSGRGLLPIHFPLPHARNPVLFPNSTRSLSLMSLHLDFVSCYPLSKYPTGS